MKQTVPAIYREIQAQRLLILPVKSVGEAIAASANRVLRHRGRPKKDEAKPADGRFSGEIPATMVRVQPCPCEWICQRVASAHRAPSSQGC